MSNHDSDHTQKKEERAQDDEHLEVAEVSERDENSPASVARVLPPSEWWRCSVCREIEQQSRVRCEACSYLKPPQLSEPLWGISPQSRSRDQKVETVDENEVLERAFEKLKKLAMRAQQEGGKLSAADRADLFEGLLLSLIKIERGEARRALVRAFMEEEVEQRKRKHMLHLSLIWFLGICTGFALYFGLQSVS